MYQLLPASSAQLMISLAAPDSYKRCFSSRCCFWEEQLRTDLQKNDLVVSNLCSRHLSLLSLPGALGALPTTHIWFAFFAWQLSTFKDAMSPSPKASISKNADFDTSIFGSGDPLGTYIDPCYSQTFCAWVLIHKETMTIKKTPALLHVLKQRKVILGRL